MGIQTGRFFLGLIVLCLASGNALAEKGKQPKARFFAHGIADTTSYVSGGATTSGAMTFGAGGFFEIGLGNVLALDLGATYLVRKFGTSEMQLPYIAVPALLRLRFGAFSLGAGVQVATAMGDMTTSSGTQTFEAAGFGTLDMGMVGAVGIRIPVKKINFLIEGRYNFGFYNVSGVDGIVGKFNDLQILAGIGITLSQ